MASDGVPLEELLGNDVEPERDVELRHIDRASGIACIDRIHTVTLFNQPLVCLVYL